MKWYLINNKPDDYGNCNKFLLNCTPQFIKKMDCEIYYYKEVKDNEIEVLQQYFDILNDYRDEFDNNFEKIQEFLEDEF